MERIRTVKKNNYSIVSNRVLRESKMSTRARGFLVIVLSLPPDWDFSIRGLRSIMPEGRDAIYSMINELIDFGYCKREQTRAENGRLGSADYVFYEEPLTEKSYTDNPFTEKSPQLNKDLNKIKNKESKDLQDEKNFVSQILQPSLLTNYIEHFYAHGRDSMWSSNEHILSQLPFKYKEDIIPEAAIPIKYIQPLQKATSVLDAFNMLRTFYYDHVGTITKENQKVPIAYMKGKHPFSFVVSRDTDVEEFVEFVRGLYTKTHIHSFPIGFFYDDLNDAIQWLEKRKNVHKEDFGIFLSSWTDHSLVQGRYTDGGLMLSSESVESLFNRAKAIYER